MHSLFHLVVRKVHFGLTTDRIRIKIEKENVVKSRQNNHKLESWRIYD